MTTQKPVNEPAPNYGETLPGASDEVRGSMKAIQRAAIRARQVAQQTGTDLIVVRAGLVVRVPPQPKAAGGPG
jgi:hypothetical protein